MLKPTQASQFMQQISGMIPPFCDKCGVRHNKGDVEIVNEENDKIVLKLECTNCRNVYIFHISSPLDGVLNAKRAAFKTDISGQELKKFSNTEKIMNDEVLDVFMALKEINDLNQFNKLFTKDNERD